VKICAHMAQGEAIIGDFQMAKFLLGHQRDTNLEAQTFTRSTSCRFAAPELVGALETPAVPPSLKSDIWAFGMVMLQVLTGEDPYRPEGYKAEYQVPIALRDGILPSRPLRNAWVTDSVWQLMLDCWRRQPGERPDMRYIYNQLVEAEDASLRSQ
jgi:serine/threonine protein kinase